MTPHQIWALRVLSNHERVALGWLAQQPGSHHRDDDLATLTELTAMGLAMFDPTTLTHTISPEGTRRMRRMKKRDTTAAAEPVEPEPVTVEAPLNVVNLEARADRLVYEFENDDDGAFALYVLRHEADLWERLSEALSTRAFVAPSTIDVPNRKRLSVIEEALDEFEARRCSFAKGCGACGAVVSPGGYVHGGYLTSEAPSFHRSSTFTALCSFCSGALATMSSDELRERVGMAIAGVASMPGPGQRYRFSHKALVSFAHEVGEYGLPWGHVTPVQRRAVELMAAQTVHPSRFIRTPGQADSIAVPGIVTKVHGASERPASVPPTILRPAGPTPAEEAEAVNRFHEAERQAFLDEHPRPWSDSDAWTALLDRQENERKSPALLRQRLGGSIAAPPPAERPAPTPPTIKRREPTSLELLEGRQDSERREFLAQHPRPAQSGREGAWDAAAGWAQLLARHERERRTHDSGRDAEAATLQKRHAAARDVYLRSNPKPRSGEWPGSDGWAALLEAQERELRATGYSVAAAR
jgi:hypothetical protein